MPQVWRLPWRELDENTVYAHSAGTRQQYLVGAMYGKDGPTAVRLCRVPETVPMHEPLAEVRAALATELVFALGRGPGRPAGEPEMRGLVIQAQQLAERYDLGEDLEWLSWQHDTGRCPGPGGCLPDEDCSYRADDCAAR
jgi:hypothetical protein